MFALYDFISKHIVYDSIHPQLCSKKKKKKFILNNYIKVYVNLFRNIIRIIKVLKTCFQTNFLIQRKLDNTRLKFTVKKELYTLRKVLSSETHIIVVIRGLLRNSAASTLCKSRCYKKKHIARSELRVSFSRHS